MDKTAVEEMVKSMIKEFADDQEQLEVFFLPKIWIYLSPWRTPKKSLKRAEAMMKALPVRLQAYSTVLMEMKALLEGYPNVKFFEDSTLASGDCQVKSRFGLLDGRIATKLRKVEEELRGND